MHEWKDAKKLSKIVLIYTEQDLSSGYLMDSRVAILAWAFADDEDINIKRVV